jgi:hypothetical protein
MWVNFGLAVEMPAGTTLAVRAASPASPAMEYSLCLPKADTTPPLPEVAVPRLPRIDLIPVLSFLTQFPGALPDPFVFESQSWSGETDGLSQ